MSLHRTNAPRHNAPARQSARHDAGKPPQAAPHQRQPPTDRLDQPPSAHAEKVLSRRLHRKQAAYYLGVSLSWLDKSRLHGEGPAFLQVGSRVLYDTADLDSYLASCRRRSTSERR
jgi:hypothetical protein